MRVCARVKGDISDSTSAIWLLNAITLSHTHTSETLSFPVQSSEAQGPIRETNLPEPTEPLASSVRSFTWKDSFLSGGWLSL